MRQMLGIALGLVLYAGCKRPQPDAAPEGTVRQWIELMEEATEATPEATQAYALLGPRARAILKERAERTSRGQGRRYAPHDMLAYGRFGLHFRPKSMTSVVQGETAIVEVRGDAPSNLAKVQCVREDGKWRIEPEIPPLAAPAKRPDAGE